ncbi:diguanylate cyclase [Poseidonibacter lekithochrous]|uniref:GGDEF domain-containing response regulator n=1 Tax=Poseidonibacter lekithochrous TaxID=1904463 RepID=UPI0008FCBE53|nr:diguanylate cyclase [Poseidonibacter lekithochrous]QKJ24539.1 response regulator receiver-modulated diguanylate cyclase [Poseidonibacter lekithochrous]
MDDLFLSKINLLYVEDEESIRNILAKRLSKKVNTLYTAENGEDGYNKFLENSPDMILTDVTMPKLNGIEMTKKIREYNRDIPIIILSANDESNYLLSAIENEVSGYIMKPLDKDKLYDVLEKNAKAICLEKINLAQQQQIKKQQVLLQNIINSERNMTFLTDFYSLKFANNSFLDFFGIQKTSEFKNDVITIFEKHEKFLDRDIVKDEFCAMKFFNEIEKLDETKRVVLIKDRNSNIKSFYISLSKLDNNLFLVSLTDITKMTLEKIDTEQKAYYDGLTGIYNRNKFQEVFEYEVKRVHRYKYPLSIAILDIDHFKNFNDQHGHLIGDEVLILIAKKIQEKIRETDTFARWGGEEFILLFFECTKEDAKNKADFLRKEIEKTYHETAGRITVSIGISQYQENDSMDDLFKKADDALYRAKENGRNRVEI